MSTRPLMSALTVLTLLVVLPSSPPRAQAQNLTEVPSNATNLTEVPSNATSAPSSPPISGASSPSSVVSSVVSSAPSAAPSAVRVFASNDESGFLNKSTYFNYDPSSLYGPGSAAIEAFELNSSLSFNRTYYRNVGWANVSHPIELDYWLDYAAFLRAQPKDEMVEAGEDLIYNRLLNGTNLCAGTHNDGTHKQSPINLVANYVCKEHHEIRHLAGDLNLNDYFLDAADNTTHVPYIEKQILPSKLRLKWWRRPYDVLEPDPPRADFPFGWGGFVESLHADIKLPGEHMINNQSFVGEYSLWHYHTGRNSTPIMSIMMDLHPNNTRNEHLDLAIQEFQSVFDANIVECEAAARRSLQEQDRLLRRMNNVVNNGVDADGITSSPLFESDEESEGFSTMLDEPEEDARAFERAKARIEKRAKESRFDGQYKPMYTVLKQERTKLEQRKNLRGIQSNWRNLQLDTAAPSITPRNHPYYDPTPMPTVDEGAIDVTPLNGNWDPFDPELRRSIWFYGYEGSLTEPPCSEFQNWRVMDLPMLISTEQLAQLKFLLFNQAKLIDGTCQRTGVHYEGSVARPIQASNERRVWHCIASDYLSDVDEQRLKAERLNATDNTTGNLV